MYNEAGGVVVKYMTKQGRRPMSLNRPFEKIFPIEVHISKEKTELRKYDKVRSSQINVDLDAEFDAN